MISQTRYTPLNAFLSYLQFEKRYSMHTITAYSNDLIQFFDFVETQYEGVHFGQITGTMVRTWLAGMKESEMTGKTLNRKISSLKSFFKYQIQQGQLTKSPMDTVISPKVNKRLPAFVAENDMEQLLTNLEFDCKNHRPDEQNNINPPTHARDVEFKKHSPIKTHQLLTQNGHSRQPCITLSRL
jgi:integrase/recombinase XerC